MIDTVTHLADEVGGFVFVLLGDGDSVLPDGVVAFVSLPGLELGDDLKVLLLLLLEVLVESEGVVLLFGLAITPTATVRPGMAVSMIVRIILTGY